MAALWVTNHLSGEHTLNLVFRLDAPQQCDSGLNTLVFIFLTGPLRNPQRIERLLNKMQHQFWVLCTGYFLC